ncbi:hypothetical protein OOZ15_00115 [Galbibacter sp. EGI 63066]|uniref:hypothetical protein n=1 Tax=Galbibacter sp. EGI 63066 TaxID=2993559 RepID=UPI002248B6AC|nr:hypothetical protein [Galbibacter sp. EGI 63066]MCX2678333.1 hypothetical protein [Galbibacter sp. EGI 63066]
MKKDEVPQDDSSLSEMNAKELCYAVDKDGNYITAKSTGWEAKTIALENAMQVIKERVENARQRVIAGKTSPIEYYMELHKMEVNILASYVGMFKWRVKRHFKPKVFKKLSDKVLQKYADVFEMSIDDLKRVPNED